MHKFRVMVVGGYGFFGSRLSLQKALHIGVAGRSGATAQALVEALLPEARGLDIRMGEIHP